MKIDSAFLRSKVARRLFALFVASALLPISMLVLLSFDQVTGQLIENGYRQLHRDNKAAALTIFERLSLARSELELAGRTRTPDSESLPSLPDDLLRRLREHFIAIHVTTAGGKVRALLGEDPARTHLGGAAPRAPGKENTVVWSHEDGAGRPHVFMSVVLSSGTITGEVRADFLWNVALDATAVLCVLGESGALLYCSDPVGADVLESARRQAGAEQAGRLVWELDGRTIFANFWSLFLEHSFRAGQWTVILGKPEAEVLSAVTRFKSIFPPVVAFSILLVVLLSISQIRRYLIPLERLGLGTRQIAAGNFSEPVMIKSGDEFEELAGSFNAMAARLGRQFGTLSTMAEIDRLILSSTDADYIVETLLRRLYEIVPCRSVCVGIVGDDGRSANIRFNRSTSKQEMTSLSYVLTPEEIESFLNESQQWIVDIDENLPGHLASLADEETSRMLFLPVVSKDGLAAFIAIGIDRAHDFSQEDVKQAREIADRTAVALSNIAWEEKLYHQAHYDALTDLPNRILLRDRLEQAMSRASRQGTCVAVLFLDLDRFKSINDSLGHVAGDRFLEEMAVRLTRELREGDTVVRFGGDEFVIIIPDIASDLHIVTTISIICENILAATIAPFLLESHEIKISSSIGVAIYPQDADNFDDLLKNSDTAMYHAKSQGRDNYQFYAQDLNAAAMQRFSMQNDLHSALENDELELFYQPKVDLQRGALVGAECLIRWQHPEHGFVSPSRFIPIAEDTGLIARIDEWVLRTACAQSRLWQDRGLPAVRMAVNLSARQFHNRTLVAMVRDVLAETRIQADLLELEVTEGAIMTDIEQTIETLRALSEMGVHIAVDDFGTGYSSLAYLAQFPLDVLKIDQSFVRDVVGNADVACVVTAIVSLAHGLGLTVVAEGVESTEQLEFLRGLDCEEIQGYFYSRPLPAGDFEKLLVNGLEQPVHMREGASETPSSTLRRRAAAGQA